MNFDQAFDILVGHEGGYVMDARDPGGETKFGISKRSYPHLDIKALTLEDARLIYRRDFWGPAGCDVLPDALRYPMFDMAVNSGVAAAVKCLQRACGADVDGVLGPRTLMAVQSANADKLYARFYGNRLALMAGLPQWPAFGRGWALRIATELAKA